MESVRSSRSYSLYQSVLFRFSDCRGCCVNIPSELSGMSNVAHVANKSQSSLAMSQRPS